MSSAASYLGRDSESSPSRDLRRSTIHSTIAGVLSSISMMVAGMTELAREAPRQNQESIQVLRTIHDLRDMLRLRYSLELSYKSPANETNDISFGNEMTCSTDGARVPTLTTVIEMKSSMEDTSIYDKTCNWTTTKWRQVQAVTSYLSHYRMSAKQAADKEKPRDCNDDANILCEEMSREFGLPMHLISVWPAKPHQRLDHDWHQFACCKLDDGRYLIMDKHRATLWSGSLEEYAQEHPCGGVPTSVIPILGIAEYREPLHDCVASKALLQVLHVRPGESYMRSAEIPDNPYAGLFTAR